MFLEHFQQTAKKKLAYDIGGGRIKKGSTSKDSNKLPENVSRCSDAGPAEEAQIKSTEFLYGLFPYSLFLFNISQKTGEEQECVFKVS